MSALVASNGILHSPAHGLLAFEHNTGASSSSQNYILFIPGLGDTILSVHYAATLATLLPTSWRVIELALSSASKGWTTSSLKQDAEELETIVRYFRNLAGDAGKIVLMGHSTGCQISAEYVVGPWKNVDGGKYSTSGRPKVDGVVLQAGISDREGVADIEGLNIPDTLTTAKNMVKSGNGGDHMSKQVLDSPFLAQPTAQRWVSLVDEEGDDDYFSSDIGDERIQRIWGLGGLEGIKMPVCVMWGEQDEYLPKWVDKKQVLDRWKAAAKGTWDEGSGIVLGATHNLNQSNEAAVKDLCGRVVRFVTKIERK